MSELYAGRQVVGIDLRRRRSVIVRMIALPPAFRARIGSATRVLECLDFEVEVFTKLVTGRLRGHRGYTAIQVIPGVGADPGRGVRRRDR